MNHFSKISIASYCVFCIFAFYQKLLSKNFSGANQYLKLAIDLFSVFATVVGIVYLIFYGWHTVWWAALIIFFIGIISCIVGVLAEKLSGPMLLGLAGFVILPISGYFMFAYVPR